MTEMQLKCADSFVFYKQTKLKKKKVNKHAVIPEVDLAQHKSPREKQTNHQDSNTSHPIASNASGTKGAGVEAAFVSC